MSSVKIRTTKVTLDALRSSSELRGIEPASDGGFLVPFDVNKTDRIMVYIPEELPMKGPDELHIPLLLNPDMSGALTRQLGEQYDQSVVTMASVKLLDPDELVVTSATSAEATHLLVYVKWPSGAAPAVTMGRRKELGAVFYARSDDHTSAYGMDVWLLPISVLDLDVIEDLTLGERVIQSTILQAWQIYELEKPYYKARMEELFAENEQLREIFRMAEDYIVLNDGQTPPDVDLHMPFWYNQRGVDGVLRLAATTLSGSSHCLMDALFGGMPPISVVVMGCAPSGGPDDDEGSENPGPSDAPDNPD